ncbi:hypothetical protein JRQ81_002006 [Phrynocephalus forsythii]|uniref:Uncharacterized protein n=1 Tax=Phrynocephalus forsythii TaxID=171643 RepID=A0A9Q0XH37_9SAUR|nr:hypothetical protein JRQ81_002006 [Phrynocephalus forsythii]
MHVDVLYSRTSSLVAEIIVLTKVTDKRKENKGKRERLREKETIMYAILIDQEVKATSQAIETIPGKKKVTGVGPKFKNAEHIVVKMGHKMSLDSERTSLIMRGYFWDFPWTSADVPISQVSPSTATVGSCPRDTDVSGPPVACSPQEEPGESLSGEKF